jgi:hypothetical protein
VPQAVQIKAGMVAPGWRSVSSLFAEGPVQRDVPTLHKSFGSLRLADGTGSSSLISMLFDVEGYVSATSLMSRWILTNPDAPAVRHDRRRLERREAEMTDADPWLLEKSYIRAVA